MPTASSGDGEPTIALNLTGLQLPGGSAPRDISLSVSDVDEIDDAAMAFLILIVEGSFQMTTWELPATLAMRPFAFAQKYPLVALDDYPNADIGTYYFCTCHGPFL